MNTDSVCVYQRLGSLTPTRQWQSINHVTDWLASQWNVQTPRCSGVEGGGGGVKPHNKKQVQVHGRRGRRERNFPLRIRSFLEAGLYVEHDANLFTIRCTTKIFLWIFHPLIVILRDFCPLILRDFCPLKLRYFCPLILRDFRPLK